MISTQISIFSPAGKYRRQDRPSNWRQDPPSNLTKDLSDEAGEAGAVKAVEVDSLFEGGTGECLLVLEFEFGDDTLGLIPAALISTKKEASLSSSDDRSAGISFFCSSDDSILLFLLAGGIVFVIVLAVVDCGL